MKKILFAFAVVAGVFTGVAHAANNCTGATYYDSDTDTCIACPDGYDYNTDSGKTDVTQCQIHCDGGTYVETAGIVGYTQLEYIESTGTQYIDTGYKPNDKTAVKTKLFTTSATTTFFGSRWSGSPTYDTFGALIGGTGRLTVYFGRYSDSKYTTMQNTFNTNTVHDFELNLNNFVLDGVSYPITRSTFASSFNLYLGSFNNVGDTKNYLHGRLYPVKIYDNNTLIRDMVPARRNSDGVLGMYDKVTNTFFTNAGTGTFIAGSDVGAFGGECVNVGAGYYAAASIVNYGSIGTRTACPAGTSTNGADNASECTPCAGATYSDETGMAACKSCPAGYDYNTNPGKDDITDCQMHCDAGTWIWEYTQLEYIESTGTQYIDTNIPINTLTNPTIETTFQMLSGGDIDWFGTLNIDGGTIVYDIDTNNKTFIRFGTTLSRTFTYQTGKSASNLVFWSKLKTLKITGNNTVQIYVDDELVATSTVSGASFADSKSILIGRGRTNGSVGRARWAGFKIMNNSDVLFNGIPVRRNSDGTIGMYDTVTNTFFANAGTGTFIAGQDVGGWCVNVGAGYYAVASIVNYGSIGTRTACPVGTSTNGADNASACTPCIGATYSDETGMAACKSCPAGYDYNTDPGKDDITDCQMHCDAGTYVSGYTQLEYIESTGTQRILTGVSGLDIGNWQLYLKWMPLSVQKPGYKSVLGAYTNEQSNTYRIIYNQGQTSFLLYGNSKAGGGGAGVTADIDTIYEVLIENGFVTLDNTVYTTSIKGNTISGASKIGIGDANVRGRFYASWATQDGVYKYNMIPARRNSDGVLGMYDMVTGTFFTNSGTGEFIAGSDVGAFGGGECVNVGAGYYAVASIVNYGSIGTRTACPAGLYTVGYGHGADNANDCGRILYIGDNVIYMRCNKETTPSVNIQMTNGDMFYISLSPINHNVSRLHFSYDGNEYTAYDDSLLYGERDFDTGQQISQ